MNITLVTETFPPEINGVAMTLQHLVEGLVRRGNNVCVVRPRQKSESAPLINRNWDELVCPGVPMPGYPLMRLGLPARGRLLNTWKVKRPDLVHVATEGPLGYSALSAAGKLGIPVTSSFHTNFHQYGRHYGAAWLARPALAYLRHFHNRTRITLSPSPDLNDELTRDGFKNVRLLARGVNTGVFTPAARDDSLRSDWGAGPNDPVGVHVSRLASEKNYPLVIKAFEAVRAKLPNARFVIVSDGPVRPKLESNHPWIHFTGFVTREKLARIYASADFFPYASQTETFGNVVTEALASGLPVIAFRYAAAGRFIKDGENGRTIPFGEDDAFVAATVDIASSPELRSRISAAARQTALTISWDQVIHGFELDLTGVLAQSDVSTVTA